MMEDFYSFNNVSFMTENNNNNPPQPKSFTYKSNNFDEKQNTFIQNIKINKLLDEQLITSDDGTEYKGQTLCGKRNGKGVLTNPDKKIIYEGEWKNDIFHGEGILNENMFIYNGSFLNGKKEGKGKLSSDDNTYYYTGNWKEDEKTGDGNALF